MLSDDKDVRDLVGLLLVATALSSSFLAKTVQVDYRFQRYGRFCAIWCVSGEPPFGVASEKTSRAYRRLAASVGVLAGRFNSRAVADVFSRHQSSLGARSSNSLGRATRSDDTKTVL